MSDISVTFDPVETAEWLGIAWDPSRHRLIPESDFIKWARKRFNRPSLFEYEHIEEGSVVLADWVYPGKVMQELECYRLDVPGDGRPDREYMEARMVTADVGAKRMRDGLRDMHKTRRLLMEEARDQQLDRAKWLRSKGMEIEAKLFTMGAPSWAPGTAERVGRWREELNRLARNKVYSTPE